MRINETTYGGNGTRRRRGGVLSTKAGRGSHKEQAWVDRAVEAVEAAPSGCALDYADAGPLTLEDIGDALGVTRERARQVEQMAMGRIERAAGFKAVRDLL